MPLQITFNLAQALQLVALFPCVLVVIYLVLLSKNRLLAIIPTAFFLALSLGFLHYLLPVFGVDGEGVGHLALSDLYLPALSFLLIFQFLLNRIPPAIYWSIIVVPVVVTVSFAYGLAGLDNACVTMEICIKSSNLIYLVNIIVSSFVYMLLLLLVSRRSASIIGSNELKRNKYWLVISLIIYGVFQLIIDLLLVDGVLSEQNHILSRTLVKIAFIYMVMTSIFRVFTDLFDMRSVVLRKTSLSKYEAGLGKKIINLMEDEKIYRDIELNRAKLAKRLGIGEHLLSRIINIEFKKSFSDLNNEYKISEAKERLANSDDPITSVSFNVGFNSIASFNRVFKSLTGKSPSQYREYMKEID